MNDKELLELAAKAAGMDGYSYVKSNAYHGDNFDTQWVMRKNYCPPWNPLFCSKDALRLAVKLELDIVFLNGDTVVLNACHGGGDPNARTRLAIVNAAASIGKAMP